MITLPPPQQLIHRCKALAALDLIFSPEWDSRYYSFNANWSEGEQMASMRNGCGDEWWIVFHRDGWAALKGLARESKAWSRHGEKLSLALQRSFPPEFEDFCAEPAFAWDATSFAYFISAKSNRWTRVNDSIFTTDDAGDAEFLALLVGPAADYAAFASDYYEVDVDEFLVADIFALRPITGGVVSALNPSNSLEAIAGELYGEIRYP